MKRKLLGLGIAVILGAAIWVAQTSSSADSPESSVAELFLAHRSGVMVEAEGRVVRVLPDDKRGSRHQRFVLELDEGRTLLISHNIDLAPRIPDLAPGQRVYVRGQYEWNSQGGLLHWTHHDPDGTHQKGWIETGGRRYD